MHTQNVNNKTATTPPPERWVAEPLRFIPSRYQAGVLLREDVLAIQFAVQVIGNCEYPQEDLSLATFTRYDEKFLLGTVPSLTAAAALALDCVQKNAFPYRRENTYNQKLGHDAGALSFQAKRISVIDLQGNNALGGIVTGGRVNWLSPVWGRHILETRATIAALNEEAARESGWDNFSTARRLWDQAAALELTFIHRRYWYCVEMLAVVGTHLYDLLFATQPELTKLVAIQGVEDDVRTVGGEQ